MVTPVGVMPMLPPSLIPKLGKSNLERPGERYPLLWDDAEIDRTMQRLRGEATQRQRVGDRLGNLLIRLGCRLKRVPVSDAKGLTDADRPSSATTGK